MTPEDRQHVEKRLVYPGAQVQLQCDQYAVTLQVERDKLRMVVTVFVDGSWKGIWLSNDCEERRRFMRPITKVFGKPYTPAQIRLLGKKWCAEQRKPRTYYVPYWASVKSLLRHFEKNNRSVELVKAEAA